jgi:hypothetical protein
MRPRGYRDCWRRHRWRPACGWWIGGFGLEQSDAEELALLGDALDHVPVELELADDDGGKVNPTGAQLIERHWLRARLPEVLEHRQLLGFNGRHRSDSLPRSPVLTQLSSAVASWSPASVNEPGQPSSARDRRTPCGCAT